VAAYCWLTWSAYRTGPVVDVDRSVVVVDRSVVVVGRSVVAVVAGRVVAVDCSAVVAGASAVAVVAEPDAVPDEPAPSSVEQAANASTRTPTVNGRTMASWQTPASTMISRPSSPARWRYGTSQPS
jgi:hypothetical protein